MENKKMWTRHELHPRWKELEKLCSQIERLKKESHNLREKIDKDLDKYSNEELEQLKK